MTTALKNQAFSAVSTTAAQISPGKKADSAQGLAGDAVATASEKELREKAQNLIGQTFYATLMKQMHDSPFKSELFNGGRGGEAFSGMLDQTLAQRMSAKMGDKLTRPIVRKFKAAAADAYKRNQNTNKDRYQYVPHDRRA
jgi:Rod binding domain-containing protein